MNAQYRKNLKAVAQACKDYTDTEIKKSEERILSIVARNNVDFIDHTDEATYRFTAPANAKLLMLQSIAGNSNKIAPNTPSDDSVARLKVIPENTYKSQIDYIGGKTVKYNQLVTNPNFTSASGWNVTAQVASYSIANNQATFICNAQNGQLYFDYAVVTHKYFAIASVKTTSNTTAVALRFAGNNIAYTSASTSWQLISGIFSVANAGNTSIGVQDTRVSGWDNIDIDFIELIDLTDKFGAGNEPTTVEEAIPLLKANGYKLDGTDTYSTGSLKHAITTSVVYSGTDVQDITLPIPNEVLADVRYGLGFDNTNYNHLDSDGHLRGKYNTRTYTSSNVIEYATSFTNVKYFIIRKPDDYIGYGSTVTSFKPSKFEVSTTSGDWDSANNIGKILATFDYSYFSIGFPVGTTLAQAQAQIDGLEIIYELNDSFDQDYSQYFDTNWNKVDLDNQYATCEMVVDESIDMPNKVEYYGTIIHSLATAVKQDGFNVWDEEWELGLYDVSSGAKVDNTINIRSKNYISVMPSTTYYFKRNNIAGNILEYDSNHNFIQVISSPTTFTTSANTKYITFYMGSGYGTTYKNDICINESGTLNGTYKPYKAPITRLLPNSEAKYGWGITDGVRNTRVFCDDECNPVNEGQVNTASYTFTNNELWLGITFDRYYCQSINTLVKKSTLNLLIDNNMAITTQNEQPNIDNSIAIHGNGNISIRNTTSVNSNSEAQSYMAGKMLYYEKETTTPETLDDFDFSFDCEEGDTFTIIGCELLQCYATYSFLIKEAKSNE